jgi:putative ABC transport system permease protein
MLLKQLKKCTALRAVNLIGLAAVTAGLILSFSFVKKELSYDRMHEKAERIARMSFRYDNEPLDGRIFGIARNSQLFEECPSVEDVGLMSLANTGLLQHAGKSKVINNFVFATPGFFKLFDFTFSEGGSDAAPDSEGKVALSASLARQLFGDEPALGREIKLTGRQFNDKTLFVSGVYRDIPSASHFHTDLIAYRADNDGDNRYSYAYILLRPGTTFNQAAGELAAAAGRLFADNARKPSPELTPLVDIRLHGRALREIEPNGNINYIYLVSGANALLLIIVMFNLWLNAGLIFARNRKFYRLLRLNGASARNILGIEAQLAALLGLASVAAGALIAIAGGRLAGIDLEVIEGKEWGALCGGMIAAAIIVSLWPLPGAMASTIFTNKGNDEGEFSLARLKYMLIAQYAMVMFIAILGFGISRQMQNIRTLQVGGDSPGILVMKEQPAPVQEKYDLLKAELLKHPEIEAVTAAMQLPGSAVRDALNFKREGQSDEEALSIPILVAGNDFLPFFNISPEAGANPLPVNRPYAADYDMVMQIVNGETPPPAPDEEYILNSKAAQALGYASIDEAVGSRLHIVGQSVVAYIQSGRVAGVTGNFTYATAYEDSFPMIILSRKFFLHCIMVRFAPGLQAEGVAVFNRVWNEAIPDYPADYTFLGDIYSKVYANEWNAESLVRLFAVLSLTVANLGLIIIMAFLVKRKTREIGIRKVHGASRADIVKLLNGRILLWIALAFVVASPPACWVMSRWLDNFAQKISLGWQIFAMAGAAVLVVAMAAVSLQSLRASRMNPVRAIASS